MKKIDFKPFLIKVGLAVGMYTAVPFLFFIAALYFILAHYIYTIYVNYRSKKTEDQNFKGRD